MARRFKQFPSLEGAQAEAADPLIHASVSASAGSGKTHVLTARVLRLLLTGVQPESILCLTFTKAGAAEMANRIGARLASWVRLKEADLAAELSALGEDVGPKMRERARRLFARVLDAPGGLRIQTIHSFAQTLLASFPAEAGIAPGFRPIEGRAEQELARRTLADLIADAETTADAQLIEDIQKLSLRLGEQSAEEYLLQCARRPEAFAELGPRVTIEPALRSLLGLPEGDIARLVASRCTDDSFNCALLRAIAAANATWGSAKGMEFSAIIDRWLGHNPDRRAVELRTLAKVVLTEKDEPRSASAGQRQADPDYDHYSSRLLESVTQLLSLKRRAELAAVQSAGLRAGQAFAAAYDRAKRAGGVADFDDLIRWTRGLLATPGMGEWVRFKLDQRTDHVLIDEAQDTNADQWAIVEALADEFFSGSSEAEGRARTLFMVGDFKQAIFGFQGTNPQEFEAMKRRTRERADAMVVAAHESETVAREFRELSISASFRSAPAVLHAVDAMIAEVGHESMGLEARPDRHVAHHSNKPGRVEWWPAFQEGETAEDEENGEEGWVPERTRLYANYLATEIKAMLDEAPVLATTGRPLGAGDILVLVRARGRPTRIKDPLASLIVARLFAKGVPVAGIDRLHLSRPLAVKDLLAAMAFAVQPLDDLNLANLLVSPLIGWDQDRLFNLAHARSGALWRALTAREHEGGHLAEAGEALRGLLAMADYTTPARFLETILSGRMNGRRRLLGRLGPEARDPIDELLATALEFERQENASLDRFLAWFGKGEIEIKRDPSAPLNAVRVMTVHGAKGLEAPVVILADATADPARMGSSVRPIEFPLAGNTLPLIRPRKEELCPPFDQLLDDESKLDLAEHWRLLYVGMTRAAERLVVTGVMPRGRIAENSWHVRVQRALESIGGVRDEATSRIVHATLGRPVARTRRATPAIDPPHLPDWLHAPAPAETRPPRPLAPSAITEDDLPLPPPTPAQTQAARRGIWLHLLFERLPGVDPNHRRIAALRWLEHSAGVTDQAVRESLADAACSLIEDLAYSDLFGPSALAEAPIAATLDDGRVVAGTVDRLLVEPDRVRVIDFKTGNRVPQAQAEIPRQHRNQMAAYAEALRVIFPGRPVEAALLYTAGPKLLPIDC